MWLEEMAWMWLPILCLAGAYSVWRMTALTRKVRALSKRVEALESVDDSKPSRARAAIS